MAPRLRDALGATRRADPGRRPRPPGRAGRRDDGPLPVAAVLRRHAAPQPDGGPATSRGSRTAACSRSGRVRTKCHQAVMLAVLRELRDSGTRLRGRLLWSVSREGRSSHACTERILAALPDTPPSSACSRRRYACGVQVGNRGRVDVDVRITGRATHSSVPEQGASAIAALAEVVHRVAALSWPDAHPRLGARHAVVYKARFSPVAPHTIPGAAELTIDRRLLPGDDAGRRDRRAARRDRRARRLRDRRPRGRAHAARRVRSGRSRRARAAARDRRRARRAGARGDRPRHVRRRRAARARHPDRDVRRRRGRRLATRRRTPSRSPTWSTRRGSCAG